MIGIYKITNNLNGKMYIGQSNNIDRRFKEHQQKGLTSKIPVDAAILKYGKENFSYEILEECSIEQLNDRETYWILYYDSINKGYNCSVGGAQQSVGENNGMSKVTEKDVQIIRQAYNNHKRQKDVYVQFQDKISFKVFQQIWQGKTWSHIMPEVFTEANKRYYIYENSIGSNSNIAKFSDEEVIKLRTRYIHETAKSIYKGYEDRITFDSFQKMLRGYTYSNLPIFKKAPKYKFSDEEILEIRTKYIDKSAPKLWEEYKDKVPYGTFKKILSGDLYTELPIYRKSQKQWINN